MLRIELEERIGRVVSDEQYNLINHVYMHHPADFSQQLVADLWKAGGLEIFKKLTPAADRMNELETNVYVLNCELSAELKKIELLKARYEDNAPA